MSYRGLRATALRSVGAEAHEQLNLHLWQLADLHEQAMNNLQVMVAAGQDDPELRAGLDNLGAKIEGLRADIQTLPDDQGAIADWHARASTLQSQLGTFLDSSNRVRASTVEGSQIRGLLWGVGAAVAVAVLGYYVWRGRRGRTRKKGL